MVEQDLISELSSWDFVEYILYYKEENKEEEDGN